MALARKRKKRNKGERTEIGIVGRTKGRRGGGGGGDERRRDRRGGGRGGRGNQIEGSDRQRRATEYKSRVEVVVVFERWWCLTDGGLSGAADETGEAAEGQCSAA